jgi:nucleoside-diphosphate-sugar epimerase
MMTDIVLVTGANGFVGRALVPALLDADLRPRRACRALPNRNLASAHTVAVGEIGPDTEWGGALNGVDAVVHLAARVHVMKDSVADPLPLYRRVNVEGTLRLAQAAAQADVKRFVFVSSVKVHGECTGATPFRESDEPGPVDPYGLSKWEAEQGLGEVATRTGLEVVILRPPLVYGPGVKANFLRLFSAVDRGLPLPLGSAGNRRSIIYVGNLASSLVETVTNPAAAGQTFLVADTPAPSTAELVRAMAEALARPARLFPFPSGIIRGVARVAGRGAAVDRMFGSLEIDSSHIRGCLGWQPPFTMQQGMSETAAWFRTGPR